jgi:exonuclease III
MMALAPACAELERTLQRRRRRPTHRPPTTTVSTALDPGRHHRCSPSRCVEPLTDLRALTFNIGAAALPRAASILSWLRRRSDDVIVLTETSGGAGTQLLIDGLRARGYRTYRTVDRRDRGVVLATRVAVAERLDAHVNVTLPWRVAGVVLDTRPHVAVLGVYVPSRDRSDLKITRKREFIDSLVASVGSLPTGLRRNLVLAGDYNAVARHHQPALPGFFPYEYAMHDELRGFGLAAAHELLPRSQQPHSWIGRTGNGYLYDYMYVGEGLAPRLGRCSYLHGPRTRRLSDHAALAVRLRLG